MYKWYVRNKRQHKIIVHYFSFRYIISGVCDSVSKVQNWLKLRSFIELFVFCPFGEPLTMPMIELDFKLEHVFSSKDLWFANHDLSESVADHKHG